MKKLALLAVIAMGAGLFIHPDANAWDRCDDRRYDRWDGPRQTHYWNNRYDHPRWGFRQDVPPPGFYRRQLAWENRFRNDYRPRWNDYRSDWGRNWRGNW